MVAKTRSRTHLFSLSSVISPFVCASQKVCISENPSVLQMSTFTQAVLQTDKAQTCVFTLISSVARTGEVSVLQQSLHSSSAFTTALILLLQR